MEAQQVTLEMLARAAVVDLAVEMEGAV
jgi:hypothetical protein